MADSPAPLWLVADAEGLVLQANDAARQQLRGAEVGERCSDLVGLTDRYGRLLCTPGCATRLPKPTERRGSLGDGTVAAVRCERVENKLLVSVRPTGASGASTLTDREREVLEDVAAGLSDPDIAAQRGLSATTIKTHIDNARRKLGAHNRAQAVARAVARGWIDVR